MGTLKRRIIEKLEPKEEPPMSTYTAKCDICGTENTVASYGDWDCRQCGQGYTYDECHQIRLTDAQWSMLRNPPRWIPVEERLPKSGQQVLACVRLPHWTHEMPTLIETLDYDQGRFLDDDVDPRNHVTHWMPLPEPPAITRDALREQWDKMHGK